MEQAGGRVARTLLAAVLGRFHPRLLRAGRSARNRVDAARGQHASSTSCGSGQHAMLNAERGEVGGGGESVEGALHVDVKLHLRGGTRARQGRVGGRMGGEEGDGGRRSQRKRRGGEWGAGGGDGEPPRAVHGAGCACGQPPWRRAGPRGLYVAGLGQVRSRCVQPQTWIADDGTRGWACAGGWRRLLQGARGMRGACGRTASKSPMPSGAMR